MKKLVIAVFIMMITWSSFAQETILYKNANGVLESVEFSADDKRVTIPASAEIFFKEMLKVKPTDEFRKIMRRQKQKEFVHEHYEQYYNGVKIEGAGYSFHYKNGKMYFAHGHYVVVSDINTKPSITGHAAMTHFAKYKNIPEKAINDYIAELIIKEIPGKTDTIPALVYRIYLYANYPQNTEIGIIDAHTGSLLMTEPAFIDFSAQGTFATRYSGSQQGITHHYQGGYHLVDSTRNAVIHTWNLEGRTNISSRVELTDNDNNWTQAEHRSNNNDMGLDVQWALQCIYDRLYNTHNINSLDDDGFAIDAYIRYSINYDNAFWSHVDSTLSFGEGGSIFRSLASVDVVAHEFGHGITHFQIGWNNTIDQRAFNEGMSDIWAVIMEHRIRPNSMWLIGEQLTLNHTCLRNIQNTNASDAMSQIANTYASSQYNSGDSYVRGGVFSHWFYLLVNGGTGTNDLGRSYSVQGVGMDNAESLIVKAVYDGYLLFTTSYAQVRTSMINAAREIAGTNSFLEHQLENAWYAVGVGNTQYLYSISGPSIVCSSGASFTVNNLPTGTTITWSQGPNLARTSAQGANPCTFSSTGSGSSWVRATLVTGSDSVTMPDKVVWSGTPQFYVSGPSEGCPNVEYVFEATPKPYSNPSYDYSWAIYPNDGYISTSDGGRYAYIYFYNVYSVAGYDVKVRAQNACGLGEYSMGNIWVHECYDFLLSPNPATETVTITKVAANSGENTTKSTGSVDEGTIFTIRIIDFYGSLHFTTTKSGSSFTIPISNLKDGNYIVEITNGKNIINKQLVIKR